MVRLLEGRLGTSPKPLPAGFNLLSRPPPGAYRAHLPGSSTLLERAETLVLQQGTETEGLATHSRGNGPVINGETAASLRSAVIKSGRTVFV